MAAHAYLRLILITSKGSAQSDDTESKEANKQRPKVTAAPTGLGNDLNQTLSILRPKQSAVRKR